MGGPFRVIVTGSRRWKDEGLLRWTLYNVWDEHPQLIVVHGAHWSGADKMAHDWVVAMQHPQNIAPGAKVVERPHPANWQDWGQAAGPMRNTEMVRAGAGLCLAFIGDCTSPHCDIKGSHDSHGTTDCADKAEAAGIETRRFRA
jgi:hypothetical protein